MKLSVFENNLNSDVIYRFDETEKIIDIIKEHIEIENNMFICPCGFDIETSSFIYDGEKYACMYIWTLGIYGYIIQGRTWEEFVYTINTIARKLGTDKNHKLLIYVHNLAYEFQFMRKWFEWEKVFCIKNRTPIYAITKNYIEFRCSYILSNCKLEKIANDLRTHDIKKLVGDLDYNLIRHNKTELTDEEIAYCVNDVKILMAYISEKIETDGGITKIPLTLTGYVRNYVRNRCFYGKGDKWKKLRYKDQLKDLTLDSHEYIQLKKAFAGGFTHANPFYSGKLVEDVKSFDFTSSYPSVMLSEKFPMSKGKLIKLKNKSEFENYLKYYCCLFDVEFTNLKSTFLFENYISFYKCYGYEIRTKNGKTYYTWDGEDIEISLNNGRVVDADKIRITITEQDFFIIRKMYEWDEMKIRNFRIYNKDYLPLDIMKSVIKLYKDKTQLKGVAEREIDYNLSKGMLNSTYGMMVTDIIRDDIIYKDGWDVLKCDVEEEIEKYNNNYNRFLFYPWGVWITAYARKNLFSAILECGKDYIYADTDSVKIRNYENHKKYFENYNNYIRDKLQKSMFINGLNSDDFEPRTIKGEKKTLGIWDDDGHYEKFKTLGAKRYLVKYSDREENKELKGKLKITVSGLDKKKSIQYLIDEYGEDNVFEHFDNNLNVPGKNTGKLTHTYIDYEKSGEIIDYKGNKGTFNEKSCIHLGFADYSLSVAEEYIDYITGLDYDSL